MKKQNRNDNCACGSGKKFKNCCGLKSKEQLFWEWFSEKSDQYYSFENDQDRLFSELVTELHRVDSNLGFEFSPVLENGKREFVITACGIKSSFPAVINLVINSPSFPKWEIIPFKQPHVDNANIQVHDIKIDAEDVFFLYGESNGKVDIELHIKDYQDTEEWGEAAYLLLDIVIGEYATETKIGGIDLKKLYESDIPNLYPITELPNIIKYI